MIKKTGLHLKNVPDIPVLHQMLSQALQKPGEKLIANWRNNETLLFTLEVVSPLKDRDPRWLLICEKSGKRSVLSQLSGHDILLIYKQIATACATSQEAIARADETSTRLTKATEVPVTGTSSNISITAPRQRQMPFPLIGKLQELPLPKLLQMISDERMSGTLQLEDEGSAGTITVQDGHPCEARLTDSEGELEGDQAFNEFLYWTTANYAFKIGSVSHARNLVKYAEILLEHERPLAQILEELTKMGMTADSAFKPSREDLNGEQFTAMTKDGSPVEMEALASLYLRLDGNSTMSDLENVQILPRPLLVRSIHHLIKRDIINIVYKPVPRTLISRPKPQHKATEMPSIPNVSSAQALNSTSSSAPKSSTPSAPINLPAGPQLSPARPQTSISITPDSPLSAAPAQSAPAGPQIAPPGAALSQPSQPAAPQIARSASKVGPPTKPNITPKKIDSAAIQSVMMTLRREDTGLFIHPAFLYFLEEEFYRIYRAKGVMSVLLFEMREVVTIDGAVRRKNLPTDAIADAAIRIHGKKRHTDVVAHYEGYDFGIILPSTKSSGARVFALKILKALQEKPLAGMQGRNVSFAFGSASIPEDFIDVSSLLGAAEMAMQYARDRGETLLFYKDLLV
jgi:diguanylate cyclase (GGDEF)-like protein